MISAKAAACLTGILRPPWSLSYDGNAKCTTSPVSSSFLPRQVDSPVAYDFLKKHHSRRSGGYSSSSGGGGATTILHSLTGMAPGGGSARMGFGFRYGTG